MTVRPVALDDKVTFAIVGVASEVAGSGGTSTDAGDESDSTTGSVVDRLMAAF